MPYEQADNMILMKYDLNKYVSNDTLLTIHVIIIINIVGTLSPLSPFCVDINIFCINTEVEESCEHRYTYTDKEQIVPTNVSQGYKLSSL